MIFKRNWIWFGTATGCFSVGHYCRAHHCRFHLCTQVGKFLVSTVGEPYLPHQTKEEEERYPWGESIGLDCLHETYETMVFVAGPECVKPDCMCGLPTILPSQVDFREYNQRGEAANGHLEMCESWAKSRKQKQVLSLKKKGE